MRDIQQYRGAVAKGSIKDMAERKNLTIDQAMAEAEVIVIVDVSGSMGSWDGGATSRWERAKNELEHLQMQYEGKVALMSFSDDAHWDFDGVLPNDGGGTALHIALGKACPFSSAFQVILITDGEPNSQDMAFAEAKKFMSPMHVIFIGEDGDSRAKDFLNRLAATTGGQFLKTAPELLSGGIKGLLT